MARTAEKSITYVLREPNSKNPTPIVGIVRFKNERIKVSTDFKVLPAHWNKSLQKVRNVVDAKNRDDINYFLERLEDYVGQIMSEFKSKLIPITKDVIKERISSYLNPSVEKEKPTTLLEFAQWYIDTSPSRLVRNKGARTGRVISPATIRRYRTTLNGLRAFANFYHRSLHFDNIDLLFYNAFTEWLTSLDHATNNVSKYVENVKSFMNAAIDEGLTTNLAFKKFSNLREDAENIYLTENELNRIYELDLAKIPRLEKVRDLFIFASWTGLRFSDFSTIQPEYLKTDEKGNKYLDLKQKKTGGRVYIPIFHSSVVQLLSKYNNCLPQGISNQKTNNYLKEIGQIAQINDRVLKHITKGGKDVVKTSEGYTDGITTGVAKWELITSHTARRSFATNLSKRRIPIYTIMKLTGHKKESEFLKYIKYDPNETMDLVRSYFENNMVQVIVP